MSRVWILKPREGIRANLEDMANSLEGAANGAHGAFRCPERSFGIFSYATGST